MHRTLHAALAATVVATSLSLMSTPSWAQSPTQDDGVLAGPKVADESLKSDQKFQGDAKKQGGAQQSKPMLELRVFNATLDGLDLDAATKSSVDEVRAAFMTRLETYEKEAKVTRKQLADQRAKAPANQPPSDEFKKAADALEANRPKLGSLKEKLATVLSPAQMEQLNERFTAGMAKARDEMTRRADLERKQKAAKSGDTTSKDATKDGAKSAPTDDGMSSDDSSNDDAKKDKKNKKSKKNKDGSKDGSQDGSKDGSKDAPSQPTDKPALS